MADVLRQVRAPRHQLHPQGDAPLRRRFNEEDVEDLVSATALNIVKDDYKKLRAFDATRGYKLSSWIGLIATNTAHDALRRRAPTEVWSAVALDDTAPVPLASEEQLASETLEAEDRRASCARRSRSCRRRIVCSWTITTSRSWSRR